MFLARRRAKKNVVFDNKMRKIANWFFLSHVCSAATYTSAGQNSITMQTDGFGAEKVPKNES